MWEVKEKAWTQIRKKFFTFFNFWKWEILSSILEKARVLRTNPEPWRNIYIKKDLRPVYRKENQRIQKKTRELKQNDTTNSEIKISDGAMTVNGEVVDRNSFFV